VGGASWAVGNKWGNEAWCESVVGEGVQAWRCVGTKGDQVWDMHVI